MWGSRGSLLPALAPRACIKPTVCSWNRSAGANPLHVCSLALGERRGNAAGPISTSLTGEQKSKGKKKKEKKESISVEKPSNKVCHSRNHPQTQTRLPSEAVLTRVRGTLPRGLCAQPCPRGCRGPTLNAAVHGPASSRDSVLYPRKSGQHCLKSLPREGHRGY